MGQKLYQIHQQNYHLKLSVELMDEMKNNDNNNNNVNQQTRE